MVVLIEDVFRGNDHDELDSRVVPDGVESSNEYT